MMEHYILKDKIPVKAELLEWARYFESADRKVARETVGDSEISTVFLGLDHSFDGGAPMIFETLVFGGKLDQEMERYSTWEQAEVGHREMVKRVREAQS